MRTIITGANGFIGKRLSGYLKDNKDEVIGLSRKNGDVSDKNNLEKIIRREKPDRIFHLAAQSNIPVSFKEPENTLNINLLGTLNLIEIIKNLDNKICFISVGSSSEFGSTLSGKKLSENSPLFPNSPYALSKMARVQICRLLGGDQLLHQRRWRSDPAEPQARHEALREGAQQDGVIRQQVFEGRSRVS